MSVNQQHTTVTTREIATEEETYCQEISHVFYCMACDFQVQTDMVVNSHQGAPSGQDELIHARLASSHGS